MGTSRFNRHLVLPSVPFGVANDHGDGTPQRPTKAHSRHDLDLVLFEAHARPPAESETAPSQLGAELFGRDIQTGRQPFDDGDQAGPVGFPCGQEAEHRRDIRTRGSQGGQIAADGSAGGP